MYIRTYVHKDVSKLARAGCLDIHLNLGKRRTIVMSSFTHFQQKSAPSRLLQLIGCWRRESGLLELNNILWSGVSLISARALGSQGCSWLKHALLVAGNSHRQQFGGPAKGQDNCRPLHLGHKQPFVHQHPQPTEPQCKAPFLVPAPRMCKSLMLQKQISFVGVFRRYRLKFRQLVLLLN